jgi:hypothetical protein
MRRSKQTVHVCFLQYPDWKAWQAVAGGLANESYGGYIVDLCHLLDALRSRRCRIELATFDAKSFREYLATSGLNPVTPKEVSVARAKWVETLSHDQIVAPKDAPCPYPEAPTATLSGYGNTETQMIDYATVAIHWLSQVEDSHQFNRDDFESPDQLTDALMLYTTGFGVKQIFQLDELLEPETCPCCGKATVRIFAGEDEWLTSHLMH